MCPTLHRRVATALLSLAALSAAASCTAGETHLPPPRRLVIYSGARLAPTPERMDTVDTWVREQWDSINLDPSFMIITNLEEGPVYPWEALDVNEQGDTARIGHRGREARGPFLIYAHLHLMAAQDRLGKWLPGVAPENPFAVERGILERVAESWMYQRSIFDLRPNDILDEIMFVHEHGYLEDFILTARPGAFVEARRSWLADSPGRQDAYAAWFRETFERDPPGMRAAG